MAATLTLFLYEGYDNPLDLHSFPTRRSSDLPQAAHRGALHARALPRGVPALLRAGAGAHPDRKSTRLNSSHGYISYAVFCLKKKTICLAACDVDPLVSLTATYSYHVTPETLH